MMIAVMMICKDFNHMLKYIWLMFFSSTWILNSHFSHDVTMTTFLLVFFFFFILKTIKKRKLFSRYFAREKKLSQKSGQKIIIIKFPLHSNLLMMNPISEQVSSNIQFYFPKMRKINIIWKIVIACVWKNVINFNFNQILFINV
jgi:hypothetical protein